MSRRVVIVGGGVVGLCTAFETARRGHDVTLLERAECSGGGCSYGNAGLIVPSHFIPLAAPGMVGLGLKWMWNPESPFWIKPRLDPALLSWCWKFLRSATRARAERAAPLLRDLALASRAIFEEYAALGGDGFGLERRGLLMLCRTQEALEHESAAAVRARELGLSAQVLDDRQAAALEPGVRLDIRGAVYFSQDCHLSPERFMGFLRGAAEEAGVRFLDGTEVRGWRMGRGRVQAALTNGGEIPGEEFVISGGAWSPAIGRGLGLTIPMQAGKGYSLTLPHPRCLPRTSAILTEARVAVTPMGGALRFGGTMEIAGMDARVRPRRVKGIVDAVPRYYPEFSREDFAGVEPWCGLRPCSPDGLPYVGRTARLGNLSLATGHAMLGLSLGPVTGRLMARLLSGEEPEIDIALLSPDRFG